MREAIRTVTRSARRAVGLIAVAVLVLAAAPAAVAATYTVGTTTDSTGSCPNPASGTCSLRQLIAFENTAGTNDTIVVPPGSYSLTNGELDLTASTTIAGAGARTTTITQKTSSPTSRVFAILGTPANGFTPTVTISGLAMSGGRASRTNTPAFFGGDLVNEGMLTLNEVSVTGGDTSAGSGAGISNDGGTLTVTHSLVAFNGTAATNDSGGIQNFGPNPITNSLGNLTVIDTTIANNTSAQGGGIFSWCASNPCAENGNNSTTITNSTVAYNDGGATSTTGGGLLSRAGTISVYNSIVAFNTVDNPSTGSPSNCGATAPAAVTSFGHNIDTGTDCGFTSTGDFQKTDPTFTSRTPQNNGGSTDTLAISYASPAVDQIGQRESFCEGFDQRGIARPGGLRCDIGAVELVPILQAREGAAITTRLAPTDCPVAGMQVNWGDGAGSAGTASGEGTHTYGEEGTYSGSVTWNSDDCGSGNYTTQFIVHVADAALATGAGASVTAISGVPFTGSVATFTDADPAGTASDYRATINWGDGSASAGTAASSPGGFQIIGTHTYAHAGSFATTISIADAGGASTIAHGTATVTSGPTPVVTGAPPSIGGTTAAFTGSVNPGGLPTTAFFQYGLDPKYTGGGPIVYAQSTPPQLVGSDFAIHIVTASVSGLVPNATYHVRLVATNSAGTTFGPDVTFATLKTPPPSSPPAVGKTFNIAPVSGVVLILINGQLVPLTELRQIPENTLIDALHGTVKLTTAVPSGPGGAHDAAVKGKKHKPKLKTQTGLFGGAIFRISQAHNGLATLSLVEGAIKGGPSYGTCKTHKADDPTATAAASRTLQLLHASAKGKFSTRGRYSAATVRGTKWTVADRCDGTLTHDITDSVAVTDFVRHKTIILHAGQSYLAKAHK